MIGRHSAVGVAVLALATVLAAGLSSGLSSGPAAAPADQTRPVPHHVIALRLDPQAGHLDVVDRLTVTGPATVDLTLAPWLRIRSATVDGRPLAPDASQMTVNDGEVREIARAYSGVPTTPEPARSSGAAGGVPGDRPLIGPEGSYLPAGGGWLAATDRGAVTYRLTVSVPPGARAAATGDLVEEAATADGARATFAAARPSEPPSVFAGPFVVRERRRGGVRLRTYFHAELADLADDYLDRAGDHLERFAATIGPYPFADFAIVSSPLPVGLGFRNLTYIGRRVLPLPFMRDRSLAHEILHNWWGNGVYVDGGNWSEGLTTYMADYALAAERGEDEARRMRLDWLRDFAALPPERDFPLTAFVARRHDAGQVVGYGKAAFVFHMLRTEIGASAFDDGIRLFWRRHAFATAGWPDLRRAFEEASGWNLGWFFDQWVRRPGAPDLRLIAARSEVEEGRHRVVLTLGQDDPGYALTVPVGVATERGSTRTAVRVSGPETEVAIDVDGAPSAVTVDPDHQVFRRLAAAELPPILRTVTLAPAATVVVATDDADEAARALAMRLLDRPPRFAAAAAAASAAAPLLVIGTRTAAGPVLEELGLGPIPDRLAGQGTAQVWAGRVPDDGRAFAVVVADDAAALGALLRPLPHYGRESYLAFDRTEVVVNGVWPAGDGGLHRAFVLPADDRRSPPDG
ncbi:MAG: M1 family metallopeptidase [Rhodospirillales bacterium]